MSVDYLGANGDELGGAVVTSEDISIPKKGINGDKDTLLDTNGTLHQRKNITSVHDPEAGVVGNDDQNYHHNPILDPEGIILNVANITLVYQL